MKHAVITGNSHAADTTRYATAVGGTTGVAFVLAATKPPDSLAHKIIVSNDSSTDYSSSKHIALVGTDADGNVQTESLTGPGSSVTSTSTKYFATLTSATPDFTLSGGDTFDIGYTAAAVTPWYDLNLEHWGPNGMGFAAIKDTGSPTFGVQQQYGDGTAFDHSVVASKTSSTEGVYATPVKAVRLIFAAAGQVSFRGWY